MNDSPGDRKKTGIPAALVDSVLNALQGAEVARNQEARKELGSYYDRWLKVYEQANTEFSQVWELFGSIEQRLNSWKRGAGAKGSQGNWGPKFLGRRGYGFSAVLTKGTVPNTEKWLAVGFAHGVPEEDGMGDERAFGMKDCPGEHPRGFAACPGFSDRAYMERTLELVSRVENFSIVFRLHHTKLGQMVTRLERSRLDQCPLSSICLGLFAALNEDDLAKLRSIEKSADVLLLK